MLRVEIKLDSALALLASLGLRLSSPDQLLAPALSVVAAALARNFDEEGRPARWTPLTPRYVAYKARRFGAGLRILERTDALRHSMATRLETGALVASSDSPYAAFHQYGARFLPARPFLVLTESDKEEIAQTVADSLEDTGRLSLGTGRLP